MATQSVSDLEQILEAFETQSSPPPPEALERFANAISRFFRLKPDEVAILEILPPGRMLRFVLPEKLRTTGTIPLSSSSALAARTARMRKTEIVNNFSTLPHASVFEGVPLGRRQEESIQKIVSSPILKDNRVIGVVQLCRKGISPMDAGPDFAAQDVETLKKLGDLLARFLTVTRPS